MFEALTLDDARRFRRAYTALSCLLVGICTFASFALAPTGFWPLALGTFIGALFCLRFYVRLRHLSEAELRTTLERRNYRPWRFGL